MSGVTPKKFWKKNVRLEQASFFELASHLRSYISPYTNSPNRRGPCVDIKVALRLSYLKFCGTLSMTANSSSSFGIATNTALDMINEVCNAIVSYVGPKYLHLTKTNQVNRKFEGLKPNYFTNRYKLFYKLYKQFH